MSTLIRNPKSTQPGKHTPPRFKKSTLTPGQRFKQRLTYNLKHPIDYLWGALSSVRNAIYLIAAIAFVCFLGVYFVQAPGEVLGDPVAYAAWVQQNALPHYGSLTPLFDSLQFFTIFSSWYFRLMLVILSLSVIVCTLNRVPAIWQNFAHPVIRRSDKFYQNALERTAFSQANAVTWTQATLRKRHYRVRSVVGMQFHLDHPLPGRQVITNNLPSSAPSNSFNTTAESSPNQEVIYLYASKNSWATLSTFVFHAALVTLLLAGAMSQWRGFDVNSPARHYLPAPLVGLTDALAGFSFDQALPNGESAIVYPRGTPHNISFRANNFTATFDSKTGLPTDYVTNLSVFRDGELVARSNHLRVNDPLSYDGIVFHQSSLIPSVNIAITNKQGQVLFNQAIVLDQTGSVNGLSVDYAKDIPIASSNQTMSVAFPHDASVQLAQMKDPFFVITISQPGDATNQAKILLRLHPGQSGQSTDKEWNITLNGASEATVLLVTRDAGSFFIWPTAVILILSLCTTFYFPQRRIWIRIQGEHVQMAALREHFTNIRTDLLGIAREATH
ncbi:MAG: cytochrome c biogenesis protein ResB [Ktedonobacteraceae bacterium]